MKDAAFKTSWVYKVNFPPQLEPRYMVEFGNNLIHFKIS